MEVQSRTIKKNNYILKLLLRGVFASFTALISRFPGSIPDRSPDFRITFPLITRLYIHVGLSYPF